MKKEEEKLGGLKLFMFMVTSEVYACTWGHNFRLGSVPSTVYAICVVTEESSLSLRSRKAKNVLKEIPGRMPQ